MFGISWAEFLIIILVAVVAIPTRHWPDVARFLARAVKFVRNVVWKITDASEQIKDQIERECPIDEIINTTTDEMIAAVSSPRPRTRKKTAKGRKK